MFGNVDGSTGVVEQDGGRTPIPAEYMAKISELEGRARSDISWAIDDSEKVWLISTAADGADYTDGLRNLCNPQPTQQ